MSKPRNYQTEAIITKRGVIKGRLKGRSPFKTSSSPSPLKERGIKGVRMINNL